MMNDYVDERMLVANACRVLAVRGLVDDILGHVSLRVDDDTVLIRARGPQERGCVSPPPTTSSPCPSRDRSSSPAGTGRRTSCLCILSCCAAILRPDPSSTRIRRLSSRSR